MLPLVICIARTEGIHPYTAVINGYINWLQDTHHINFLDTVGTIYFHGGKGGWRVVNDIFGPDCILARFVKHVKKNARSKLQKLKLSGMHKELKRLMEFSVFIKSEFLFHTVWVVWLFRA